VSQKEKCIVVPRDRGTGDSVKSIRWNTLDVKVRKVRLSPGGEKVRCGPAADERGDPCVDASPMRQITCRGTVLRDGATMTASHSTTDSFVLGAFVAMCHSSVTGTREMKLPHR
jgi:hypothetical protein